jgi:hypothetical protein
MPDANGKPLRADANTPSPLLSNTTYDVVKDAVTLGFPAAVTLYAALAVIWHWGFSEEVVATGGAIGIFAGVLLKIAEKRYNKLPTQYDGTLIANDPDPMANTFRLELDKGLPELGAQDEVRIKVKDLLPKDDSR